MRCVVVRYAAMLWCGCGAVWWCGAAHAQMPEGGFFICGDTSALALPEKYASDTKVPYDWALCRWLTVDIGVAAIPPSSFYCDANKKLAANFARFAFCKPEDVLAEAAKRFTKLTAFIKPEAAAKANAKAAAPAPAGQSK